MFRGRGRGRGVYRRVHRIMRGELRVHERGSKYSPVTIPRPIVQAPWNSFVITSTVVGDTIFLISYISKVLFSDLGIFKTSDSADIEPKFAISLRFLNVDAWEMTGNNFLMIAYSFIDNQDGREELMASENIPSKMSNARVGYRWPVSHQSVVFHNDTDKDKRVLSIHFPSGKTCECQTRLHVLWRGTQRSLPQYNLEDDFENLAVSGPSS